MVQGSSITYWNHDYGLSLIDHIKIGGLMVEKSQALIGTTADGLSYKFKFSNSRQT